METKKIYEAIPAIMQDIKQITKDKKNAQQGFMFRGIDQVMNTMKPLLAKHGVFIVPEVINMTREERQTKSGSNLLYSVLTVRHHFIATDGSEVTSVTIGEGMDNGDKASNKAMAIAFKYACFQVFCIPTEEMAKDDPDAHTPEPSTSMTMQHLNDMLSACRTIDELKMLWDGLEPEEKVNKGIIASFNDAKRALQAKGGVQ